MLQSISPLQDPGESWEEGQSPQKQHPADAGLVAAPVARAPPLCALTQGWRAGLLRLRAPRTCLCAGLTGTLSPSGMERNRWIFLHQVSCVPGPWGPALPRGPPGALMGHPTSKLVHESLCSILVLIT